MILYNNNVDHDYRGEEAAATTACEHESEAAAFYQEEPHPGASHCEMYAAAPPSAGIILAGL
ncbi:hypothetical protein E2C01_003245 [Portunus trituberculatus]|uniref:Uncharacterized protein n=1 Tax=Portunus trituberculatus TaxID=210409 RepID=A0A5B7CM35_PORTR|nr:hypothetical protein [Portunus trituberculatus]